MLVSGLCVAAFAQETQETPDNTVPFTTKVDPSSTTLFQNVRIFDGKSGTVSAPSNVLVHGNTIEKISTAPIPVDRSANTQIIVGGGRVLMPGLIDAHWHAMFAAIPMQVALSADIGYINLLAGKEAEATLMRGFTTVRDMGGPTFGLKRAIDQGVIPGPRVYPSGAFISQTSGHGDFRFPYEVPRTIGGPLSHTEQIGAAGIADGVPQVLLRSREQLMLGASQLKLMAGGGVASPYDPLDVSQYTEEEIHAAVDAAEELEYLCDRACLYPARDSDVGGCWGQVHRTRTTH